MRILNLFLAIILLHFSAQAQDGNVIFDDGYVHEIYLEFEDPNFLNAMYELYNTAHAMGENPDYIQASITIDGMTDSPFGNTLDTVGVRMKGDFSFVLGDNDKKPFKIDINEFVSGQKLDGLKKFNLAPLAGDPSFLREKIGYELLDFLGVPAPRAAFAKIYLNDEYWGLYQMVEQIDKTFLEDRFANKEGNLFKSKGGANLDWIDDNQATYENVEFPYYELKTNRTENNWSDFIAFMKMLETTPDAEFKNTLESQFNVSTYLKDLAVQSYIMNNDNYIHGGNNYYLYNNPNTEKWEWIPWDLNYSMTNYTGFGVVNVTPQSVPPIESEMLSEFSVLSKRILENEALRNQYYNEVCQLVNGAADITDIHARIDELADMIRTDVLADSRKKYSNQDFEDNVAYDGVEELFIGNMYGMKDFTEKRTQKLTADLTDLSVTECVNTTVAVNNVYDESLFSVFPNPVSNLLTIKMDEVTDLKTQQIIDIYGRKVLNITPSLLTNEMTFSVARLPIGIYFLTIQTEEGLIFSQRFVKE